VVWQGVGDRRAQRTKNRSKLAVLRTDAPSDHVTEANGECRARPSSRDGNRDVTLPVNGWCDEVTILRVVCCVEQNVPLLRLAPDRGMKESLFGGLERDDREVSAGKVPVMVLAPMQRDRAFRRELLEARSRGARDDGHLRPGVAEPADLRLGERATADHDGRAATDVEGNGIVLRVGRASRWH
jgi:hypothetical protein